MPSKKGHSSKATYLHFFVVILITFFNPKGVA